MYGVAAYDGETYSWWNGENWTDTPVPVGPFLTLEYAKAFMATYKAKSLFVYVANDPYGCDPRSCAQNQH